MTRKIIFSLISLVVFILNIMITDSIDIFGISPNLILIYIISYSLIRGKSEGAVIGFFIGLFTDLYINTSFGIFTVIYTLVGYITGNLNKSFYKESYLFAPIVGIITFIFSVTYYFIYYLPIDNINIFEYLAEFTIAECIYNAVISIILYPIIYFINEKIEDKESGSLW